MKSVHQGRTGRLVNAYVEELGMNTNAIVYGAIRKAVDAKNTDEKLAALEFLLQTIVKGQGRTDYLYDQYNY